MPREMLSGPDLGAGFLHQLSFDREEADGGPFTFHAQPGGADASGPPAGSLEPLGWSRSPEMCMFGGRLCYHRRFALPIASAGPVRAAYNRSRFVLAAEMAQLYQGARVPLADGLREWTATAGSELDRQHLRWCVAGALAEAVHGIGPPPRAVEIEVAEEAVPVAAEALRALLIEPPAPTDWGGRSVVAARAFVGTLQEGVRIGWAASRAVLPTTLPTTVEALVGSERPIDRVDWEGIRLPIAPLELLLGSAVQAGDPQRAARAADRLAERGADPTLLAAVLTRPEFEGRAFAELRRRLSGSLSPPLQA